MDVQGFGNTFASGFNNTSASGFGAMRASMQSSSNLWKQMSTDGASRLGSAANLNPNLTDLGSDDEERRA